MTDREKLVELLADHCDMKDKRCAGCENGLPEAVECKNSRFGKVADHLLANGVIFAKDTNVLTNADRIRAMNDFELRQFICGSNRCETCRWSAAYGCKLMGWLKEEAEEV